MLSPLDTDLASVTVLHAVQPGDGGVARVVVDLVRAQRAAGLRISPSVRRERTSRSRTPLS
ncbi:hypothetical protein AB0F16_19740, partial [Streptomyces tanashiensis]